MQAVHFAEPQETQPSPKRELHRTHELVLFCHTRVAAQRQIPFCMKESPEQRVHETLEHSRQRGNRSEQSTHEPSAASKRSMAQMHLPLARTKLASQRVQSATEQSRQPTESCGQSTQPGTDLGSSLRGGEQERQSVKLQARQKGPKVSEQFLQTSALA